MNQRQLFLQFLAQTSPFPLELEIVDSEGIYLIGKDQTKYADLISGIGVSIIGHKNKTVINAITEQVNKFMHTMVYGEHVLAPQTRLANRLCSLLPESLNNVYFTNSGAEAVEGAMKLAKKSTGRHEIIAAKNAYHGSTQGAGSLMSHTTFSAPFRPMVSGIRHIRFNAMEDLSQINHTTAAVILEPIQAESGIHVPSMAYMQALSARCKQTGTLLILDEIQTGLGRTGHWWAFESFGIVPDMLLLGKALGGGLPLGAFIANKSVMSQLSDRPILGHITTFGGNPVSCAASLATIDELTTNKFIETVAGKEGLLQEYLQTIDVAQIRTSGLWAAIELPSFQHVQKIVTALMSRGILVDWFLFNDHAIRLAPPLSITHDELQQNLEIIAEVIKSYV